MSESKEDNTIDNTYNVEADLKKHADQIEGFTLIPLIKLIYNTNNNLNYSNYYGLNQDVSNDNFNLQNEIFIIYEDINTNKKKKLVIYLDIVDKDYDLFSSLTEFEYFKGGWFNDLNSLKDKNEKFYNSLVNTLSYVLFGIKIMFSNIKERHIELGEYLINISNNTTIFLNNESKHLGFKFEDRDL